MDVFIIMQLFRCIPLNHKLFSGEIKSDVLTLLTKVKVRNLLLLHFFRWLYLVRGQFNMYLWHVKRPVICKCWCFCLFDIQKRSVFLKCHFHCHRSFPSKRFSSVSIAMSLFSIFYSPKRPRDTNLRIYYKTHYCCSFFDLNSPNVLREILKHCCCIFIQFWRAVK